MKKLLTVLAIGLGLHGQTAHQVDISWTDPNNPAGTQYNVYRLVAACPAVVPTSVAGFTKLNPNPISGFAYTDTPVQVGQTYCYLVTATNGTVESGPSPDAGATPIPFPVVSIQVIAK